MCGPNRKQGTVVVFSGQLRGFKGRSIIAGEDLKGPVERKVKS